MRRAAVLAVALLLALTGCGTSTGGGGTAPGSTKVSHTVLYDVHHSGDPSYKLVISYIDANGASVSAESGNGTWSQQITVQYPDVTTVAVVANATPGDGAQPPPGSFIPPVQCILWVDGTIVAQQHSIRANCEAKLTASVAPPRSPSGAPSK